MTSGSAELTNRDWLPGTFAISPPLSLLYFSRRSLSIENAEHTADLTAEITDDSVTFAFSGTAHSYIHAQHKDITTGIYEPRM